MFEDTYFTWRLEFQIRMSFFLSAEVMIAATVHIRLQIRCQPHKKQVFIFTLFLHLSGMSETL